ncbi:ATP-binding protein [Thalassobaculum sp. OXR-137]|uniref:sensor histidine kinase n=1 Tax=Thalassobaculum sp. OXR-137 TaxID=3100173 RepID=UPI002AC8D6EC|nr:ATP-binding protein [Thalassobaculum sp. OXR-137]WPZ33779.1 ATP-binding protein [Thalassobaculum sp. OXR-137]
MTETVAAKTDPGLPTRPRWTQRLYVRFLAVISLAFLLIIVPCSWLIFGFMHRMDNELLTSRIGNLSARVASAIDRHDAYVDPALAGDLLAPLASDRAFLCAELRNGETVAVALPPAQGCVAGNGGYSLELPIDDRGDWMLRADFSDAELVEIRELELLLGVSAISIAFLAALIAGGLSFRFLIRRPLNRLTDAILRSARSGTRHIVHWNSRDEMGLIVHAYNTLVVSETDRERQLQESFAQIQASETALATLNQELEQRVVERTVELEIAKREADRANDSKTQFLWSMSHELRTPLNAIIGFSEIMSRELFGRIEPGRYKEFADDILHSGKHLLKVINDLLDIARIEVGRESLSDQPTDVASLLAETLRVIAPLAHERGVRLDSRMDRNHMMLLIDPMKIRQILINLLGNAVKHTPVAGMVSVDVRIEPDGRIALLVEDTGSGIPAESLDEVMEPFGRVEGLSSPLEKGTGLGLPLARKMAELHGGALTLESEWGVGTRVTVHLPADRYLADRDQHALAQTGTGN